ncbi:MAG: lipopolysaccharide export system protein LptA [Candidatus Tokpelaia sp. JSC085]|nr:MAG: lipopolysaccharide export system protein LptA [Candidatus Tokpelaia sp. JSC085]
MQFSYVYYVLSYWPSCIILSAIFMFTCHAIASTQPTSTGRSSHMEPVQIEADSMKIQDQERRAIFTGNVSVIQGDKMLRAGKMIVQYTKLKDKTEKSRWTLSHGDLGSTSIEKMEVANKVYLKSGYKVATGDRGIFDGISNVMVLSGSKVVLTDGDNVFIGCRLTAHMDTGQAFLESCSTMNKKGRVSMIMNYSRRN